MTQELKSFEFVVIDDCSSPRNPINEVRSIVHHPAGIVKKSSGHDSSMLCTQAKRQNLFT